MSDHTPGTLTPDGVERIREDIAAHGADKTLLNLCHSHERLRAALYIAEVDRGTLRGDLAEARATIAAKVEHAYRAAYKERGDWVHGDVDRDLAEYKAMRAADKAAKEGDA